MEFSNYTYVMLIGFLVWLSIAPRRSNPAYRELFVAYLVVMIFSLIGTSEIMMVKPVPFFFTVGGVLALVYLLIRNIRVSVRTKQ